MTRRARNLESLVESDRYVTAVPDDTFVVEVESTRYATCMFLTDVNSESLDILVEYSLK